MNPFLDRMLADLRSFSSDLLEGLGSRSVRRGSGRGGPGRQAGTATVVVDAVDRLTRLVPVLLSELEGQEDEAWSSISVPVFSPVRAQVSRHPADFRWAEPAPGQEDGKLVPYRWVRELPAPGQSIPALRWLVSLLGGQDALLSAAVGRISKQVDEARVARRGGSVWAKQDERALDALLTSLSQAGHQLARSRAMVEKTAGARLLPSAQPPAAYPVGTAWQSLRQQARYLADPMSSVSQVVQALIGDRAEADVPTLYQRWVGLKLLEAFGRAGWCPLEHPAGALYLGGQITLKKGANEIHVWVEARISRNQPHPSGFFCARGDEAMPDYLVVTPGPGGGVDAFVLDATKTGDDEVLRGKGRYLNLLLGSTPTRVAGVPIARAPMRAWAAAPLARSECVLYGSDGRQGVIPMHPVYFHPEPVNGWIQDIDRHAFAWGAGLSLDGSKASHRASSSQLAYADIA